MKMLDGELSLFLRDACRFCKACRGRKNGWLVCRWMLVPLGCMCMWSQDWITSGLPKMPETGSAIYVYRATLQNTIWKVCVCMCKFVDDTGKNSIYAKQLLEKTIPATGEKILLSCQVVGHWGLRVLRSSAHEETKTRRNEETKQWRNAETKKEETKKWRIAETKKRRSEET